MNEFGVSACPSGMYVLNLSMHLSCAGEVKGDVLANTTSIGMHPQEDASPVSSAALASFDLVFDAVYTPMDTKLLQVSWW